MRVTWRGSEARRRGSRAAGCWRYDNILPCPPCRGRARLRRTRRAGAAGFATVGWVESPTACGLAPSAVGPLGVPLAPRWCGPGRGVEGGRLSRCGRVKSSAGEAEPQDVGGMTTSCRARPAGGGHAFGVPAGRARQDLRPSGWRRALRPAACAFGRRPARGATGTPLVGAGTGVEGVGFGRGLHRSYGSGVLDRRISAV